MICKYCYAVVEWRGWEEGNFTHTKCLGCGAINSQVVPNYDREEEEEEHVERSNT